MTNSDQTILNDPVLVRRAKVQRVVTLGIRLGSGLFVVAVVLFFWAIVSGFTERLTLWATICLIGGSLILAPAMVFAYAIKAANRADREGSW